MGEEKTLFDQGMTTETVAATEETLPEVTEEAEVEKTEIFDSIFDARSNSQRSFLFIQELP